MKRPADLPAPAAAICESRAYHLVEEVQSHGVLLALEEGSLAICRAPANLETHLGVPVQDVLGRPLGDFVSPESLTRVKDATQGRHLQRPLMGLFRVEWRAPGRSPLGLDAILYRSGAWWCLELESPSIGAQDLSSLWADLVRELDELAHFEGPTETFSTHVCDRLRALTGFDRVYFCEFDEDGHGFVSAESRNGELPSLLAHHFPKTDLPQRVRALYLENQARFLPDVNAPAVPLLTWEGAARGPMDLRLSMCRKVADTHLQYVRNMGVTATASFSVAHDGELEALFGGHASHPHYLSYRQLVICKQLVAAYRSRIDYLRVRDIHDVMTRNDELIKSLSRRLLNSGDHIGQFVAKSRADLLSLFQADDLVIRLSGELFVAETLTPEVSGMLVDRLVALCDEKRSFATRSLSLLDPSFLELREAASGALAISLDEMGRNAIVLLRRQKVYQQRWSGSPDEAIVSDDKGEVGPRRSFLTYVKDVEGTSPSWTNRELETAARLNHAFNQVLAVNYLMRLREAAEKANLMKSEFIANVSHELRSPMHAMLGLAELLRDRGEGFSAARRREFAELIQASGNRLLRLIDDLLDIAKLETGAAEFCFRAGNLLEVLRQATTEVAPLASPKAVLIVERCEGELPAVEFDADRLTQVFVNLLANAIRFSPQGQQIEVHVAPTAQGGVLTEVRDRGLGVPEDELEEIFEKFVQSSRTKNGAGGTGLGLSICRQIVQEGHGGKIWARNNQFGGASFFVELPRVPPFQAKQP
ncbi:MAG: hypothetical protein KA712_15305 [Myxococcales bacterium]|nr:hypothetical protein [Myxococcales bacterium]